ncbi:hypothetical protein FB567DRAFT_422162, partial [Paraphoma chrysanthemicola]
PQVRSLTHGDLLFPGQDLPFGHCAVLVRRERKGGAVVETPALREGGENNDSPRITGLEGLTAGNANGKSKIYAYHIAAAQRAYTHPEPGLTEALLRSVAKNKTNSSTTTLTVMHLCGNKWCVEGSHLAVGSKKYNDQQTFCHRGLQSAISLAEVGQVQNS